MGGGFSERRRPCSYIDYRYAGPKILRSFQQQKGKTTWEFRLDGSLIAGGPSDDGEITTEKWTYRLEGRKLIVAFGHGKRSERWVMIRDGNLVFLDIDACQFIYRKNAGPNQAADSKAFAGTPAAEQPPVPSLSASHL
jgi:hypothetical protein